MLTTPRNLESLVHMKLEYYIHGMKQSTTIRDYINNKMEKEGGFRVANAIQLYLKSPNMAESE